MDAQLRPALIGGTVMLLALGVARFSIPIATVPEPNDIDRIEPAARDYARDIFHECGGGEPFLTHEHRVGTLTTRFEFYARGEWKRITSATTGGVTIGCIKSDGLPTLRRLFDRATWRREPSHTMCDVAIAGIDAWQANGVDELTYSPCDRAQPDRATTALIDTVSDFEVRIAGYRPEPQCVSDALICYESGQFSGQLYPTAKFVVTNSGAWELTKRDIQSEMIIVHATGTLTAAELADLRGRIDRAPWTIVTGPHICYEYLPNEATVTAHGVAITWNACRDMQPDDTTQAAVDRLFEIYRSALRSQTNI